MCNLSSAIEERGIMRGFERGDKHGFERGDKQGFERGTMQAKREMIFGLENMLSIEKIAEITKLPVEEVKKILAENQKQF